MLVKHNVSEQIDRFSKMAYILDIRNNRCVSWLI
jgi:hypothetical protein